MSDHGYPQQNPLCDPHPICDCQPTPTTDRDELAETWFKAVRLQPGTDEETVLCTLAEAKDLARMVRQADAATIARMREALDGLISAVDAVNDGQTIVDPHSLEAARAALKGGDHGIAAMGEGDVR